ncbi:hypothetical protein BE221DRAFT_194354 [Ostreococcus tauri]|uniref:Uncharacterized protein n=1 Tax=Ostreococcus tauri TaxID=70448 RepID=A0A1Y5I2E8_OSTTA|nr:hypothetical protein BE221DRAFT_194354 [Ostreococcus tauri]
MALAMRCASSTSVRARPLERAPRATRSGATTMRAGRMTDGDDGTTPNAIDWRLETVLGRSAMTGMAMLPTEYEANPESLRGKTGISGFLAYEKLNLNVDVERANGRAAMVGFAVVVALESLVLHHGLFAR